MSLNNSSNPSMRALSSWLNYYPNGPLPNTTTSESKISTYKWGWGQKRESVGPRQSWNFIQHRELYMPFNLPSSTCLPESTCHYLNKEMDFLHFLFQTIRCFIYPSSLNYTPHLKYKNLRKILNIKVLIQGNKLERKRKLHSTESHMRQGQGGRFLSSISPGKEKVTHW